MSSQSSLGPTICPWPELWGIDAQNMKSLAIPDDGVAVQNPIKKPSPRHFNGSDAR
jgi:hypothetical protein